MRVHVRWLELLGAQRRVAFEPGLNIITGPIATGKTTLVYYLRFLLGGSLKNLPKEARETVTAVSGEVLLRDENYMILRPAVTTSTAKVEIAGNSEALRLPASAGIDETYVQWLLRKLDLPRLNVPSAPSKPESDPTPISINDYWLYTHLSQEELGVAVFGHKDKYKDIKRKYVFQVVYGLYDIEVSRLQERLRDVAEQLRYLQSQSALFSSFFEDTALANRAALERELVAVREELARAEAGAVALAREAEGTSQAQKLRRQVVAVENDLAVATDRIAAERAGINNLRELMGQLESQSAKLTRALVSGKHLMDIDFVVCPRCGSALTPGKELEADVCYLCHQVPTLDFSREALIQEQDAVDAQLVEAQDLVQAREERLRELQEEQLKLGEELGKARVELDFQTKTYISANADKIAAVATKRTRLRSRESQIEEYLDVLRKLDESQKKIAGLTVDRDLLQSELDAAREKRSESMKSFERLEANFNDILERFRPPEFGEESKSSINRKTFMPIYHGRSFDNLSSPGLRSLVNVAHALAHQVTALELNLRLPNILILDGLSEHLGQEGLDPERLQGIYRYLIELTTEHGEDLQVIVIDNEVPPMARSFIRLELSETDRLIPAAALRDDDTEQHEDATEV